MQDFCDISMMMKIAWSANFTKKRFTIGSLLLKIFLYDTLSVCMIFISMGFFVINNFSQTRLKLL